MAIFNSYVKLPEGTVYDDDYNLVLLLLSYCFYYCYYYHTILLFFGHIELLSSIGGFRFFD